MTIFIEYPLHVLLAIIYSRHNLKKKKPNHKGTLYMLTHTETHALKHSIREHTEFQEQKHRQTDRRPDWPRDDNILIKKNYVL